MQWVIDLVSGVRSVRAEMNVPPSAKIPLLLSGASNATMNRLAANKDTIMTLGRLASASFSSKPPRMGTAQFIIGETTAVLVLDQTIDLAKERARLEKELKKAEAEIVRFDAKLANAQFVSRAPEEVLAEQREKRADAAALAARLGEAIKRLG
jgi:valyl-tRNA synthetase